MPKIDDDMLELRPLIDQKESMMKRRWSQSGEGNIGCLIWLVVFGLVIFVGWKTVPVKIKTAELYDFMDDQARYTKKDAAAQKRTADAILSKAASLDLPLEGDNLKVSRKRNDVTIEYYYMVPIEFPGKTYEWVFEGVIERPSFVY